MFRKISFAVAAAIALSAAAMSPASAGGHGGHHGHGGHGGHGMHGGHDGHGGHWGGYRRFYGSSAYYIGGDCYKYVVTRRGLRLVNVCAYY
jgi:hypothetical protein